MKVLQQIAKIAAVSPEKVAYRSEGKEISYGELWQQSNNIAEVIRRKSLPEKSPIAVCGHMSPTQIVAFLGAVKAGHPYIPLDISIPNERIKHIVEASEASLVITTETFEIQWSIEQNTVEAMIEEGVNAVENESTWVTGDEVFYIIYTSGSTGKPKGVQIAQSNLQHFVNWLVNECSLSTGVYLNQAPYSFDLSVMDLYPALMLGNEIHAISKAEVENAALLFEQLNESPIEVWTSTPSFAKICLMNPEWNEQQMPHLKTFLFCGEVLPKKVASDLMNRFPQAKIFNLYGPTETTVAVSAVEINEQLIERFEQLPIANAHSPLLKVVDEAFNEVADETKGELVVYGPSVSIEGYLGASELSAKVFKATDEGRIYKTGDIGYKKDGYIFYAGRSDFQIKLHGYRMEIEEIEKQIERLEEVTSVIVIPVKNGEEIVSLTASIVLAEELEEKPFKMTKQLKSKLLEVIPNYMIPKKFIYMDDMPLNINGKIDRKRLAVELDQ